MSRFVLVHGSGQNSSCWLRVRDELRDLGHEIVTPELPKNAPDWKLLDYAAHIAASVPGPGSIVVGHSLCGVFLPLVPQLMDCALLVYLAAVIPQAGKSVREQFADDPTMFSKAWIDSGPDWFDPTKREALARDFLFHDCDQPTLNWALTTLENMDTQYVVTQPSPLPTRRSTPSATIVATQDRTLSPNWIQRTSQRVLGHSAIEISAGHCPQNSQPSAVAILLDHLAHDLAI